MIASNWRMSANDAMLASYGLVPLMANLYVLDHALPNIESQYD